MTMKKNFCELFSVKVKIFCKSSINKFLFHLTREIKVNNYTFQKEAKLI